MRTTVIPAQITTIEDKIAGSLNLTQVFILMMPVFLATILFAFIPPLMKLTWYKVISILVVSAVSLILSLRVKGRVVFNWLFILLRYNLRPKYYVFSKNDIYLRSVETPIETKKVTAKKTVKTIKKMVNELAEVEAVKFSNIINNRNTSLSFKLNREGGLHVAVEQIKK